jgi:hypothetical protein
MPSFRPNSRKVDRILISHCQQHFLLKVIGFMEGKRTFSPWTVSPGPFPLDISPGQDNFPSQFKQLFADI